MPIGQATVANTSPIIGRSTSARRQQFAMMPRLEFTEVAWRRLRTAGLDELAEYHVLRNSEQILRRRDGITESTGWWEGCQLIVFTDRPIEPLLVLNIVVTRRSTR